MASALVADTDTPGFVVRVNISGRVPTPRLPLDVDTFVDGGPGRTRSPRVTTGASCVGRRVERELLALPAPGERAGRTADRAENSAVMPITASRANLTRILLPLAGSDYSAICSDAAIPGNPDTIY